MHVCICVCMCVCVCVCVYVRACVHACVCEPEVSAQVASVSLKLPIILASGSTSLVHPSRDPFCHARHDFIEDNIWLYRHLTLTRVCNWATSFDFEAFSRNLLRQVERTTHKMHSCLRTKKIAVTVQSLGVKWPQAYTVVTKNAAVVRGHTCHN